MWKKKMKANKHEINQMLLQDKHDQLISNILKARSSLEINRNEQALVHEQRFLKRLKHNEKCHRQKLSLQNEKLQFLKKKAKDLTLPSKGIIDISHTFEALKRHLLPKSSNILFPPNVSSSEILKHQDPISKTTVENFDRLDSQEKLFEIGETLNELMQMLDSSAVPSASPKPKNITFKPDDVDASERNSTAGDDAAAAPERLERSASRASSTHQPGSGTDSPAKPPVLNRPSNRFSYFFNTKPKRADETADNNTRQHLIKLLGLCGASGRAVKGCVSGLLAPPGAGMPGVGPRLKALATELSKHSILLGTEYEMQPEEYKIDVEKNTAEIDKLNQHKDDGISFIKIPHDLKMEPNKQNFDGRQAAQTTARRCRQCQDVPLLPVVVMTISTPPLADSFEEKFEDKDQNGDYCDFINESISILMNAFQSFKVSVEGVVLCLPCCAAPPPCWPCLPAASTLATASHFIHPMARHHVLPFPARKVRIPYAHFDRAGDDVGIHEHCESKSSSGLKDNRRSNRNNNKRFSSSTLSFDDENPKSPVPEFKIEMPRVGVCKMGHQNDDRGRENVRCAAESLAAAVVTSLPPGLGGLLYCVRAGATQQRDLELLNELNKVPTPRWPFHVAFLSQGPDDAALLAAVTEAAEAADEAVRPPGMYGRGLTTHGPHGPGHQAEAATALARQLSRTAAHASTASMGQATASMGLAGLNVFNNMV